MGMFATPTATMICQTPWPSRATIPTASRNPGIASMMSMQAHDDRIDAAAQVARDRSQNGAEGEAHDHRHDADQERVARAPHDPRQLVAAELVEPEPVIGRRARAADAAEGREILLVRVLRRENRRQDRHQHHRRHDQRADDRAGVAAQAREGVAPQALRRGVAADLDCFDLRDGHLRHR